ncbi:MAG: ABC transporter permease subunit [Anaerolineales bacterium]|nr:ABC transporter permease subunit [Anaerolineales bacterium]
MPTKRNSISELFGAMGAYAYILPAFILYAIFFIRPLFQLISLSLVKWDGLQPKLFVGLSNYEFIFTGDDVFWLALKHNIQWLLAAIVVPTIIGLFLAMFLVRGSLYGRLAYRTIFFLPQVLSSVVIAIAWRGMYNPQYGAINSLLRLIGLDSLTQVWLGDTTLAMPALFIAWSWIHYGFCMVIFIAALQGIDETYYDAAKVDGANALQQQWYVTIPFIRGPLATVVLITAIAAFQVFDLVFIITKGGPANSTVVLPMHMYNNAFRYAKIGTGAAIAVLLGIVIFVFSVIFMRVRRRMELG